MFVPGPESGYQPTACCNALSVAGPYVPYGSGGLVPGVLSWNACTALVVAWSHLPVTFRFGHP